MSSLECRREIVAMSFDQNSPRTKLREHIARGLRNMDSHVANDVSNRMLYAVSTGIHLLSSTLPPAHPITACANIIGEQVRTAGSTPVDDFEVLPTELAVDLIEKISGRIWLLARFQPPDTKAKLLQLVEPLTEPLGAIL